MCDNYTYVRMDILSTVNKGVVCHKHHIPIVYRMAGVTKDHQIIESEIRYYIIWECILFFFKTTGFFLITQNPSLKITNMHILSGKHY